MRISDFTAPPGKLVKTIEGAPAFVPAPLPPELPLGPRTVRHLASAEHALGRLAGCAGRLVNPFLIGSPLLHREAILSSRIEGTITTAEDLVLFEVGRRPTDTRRAEDTREVQNYMRAMHHGLALLEELPVCLRLMREIHRVLLDGVRGGRERPGEFRTVQNYVARRPTDTIHDARFVPPPVEEMRTCLDNLESYVQAGDDDDPDALPLLIRLALIHYQFEAIHPFRDGNGRVGRLLIPLLLCSASRLSEPLLYLSSYFERHREQYYDYLLRVSQTGEWAGWVDFFLIGVKECSGESIEQAEGLLRLRDRYHRMFQSARSSALLLKLIDTLFKRPSITIGETARVLDVTPASASANLRKLAEAGVVIEWTGRKRDQIFVAREILEFMRDETSPRD